MRRHYRFQHFLSSCIQNYLSGWRDGWYFHAMYLDFIIWFSFSQILTCFCFCFQVW